MILVEADRPGVSYMDVGAKMGITLERSGNESLDDVGASVFILKMIWRKLRIPIG